eukprot:scaffold48472_cov42-Cyclotella_meneghiniana.AAC.5
MSDHCASCGKADANLKACKACKLVKYCGVECQMAHRAAHKKACREKARELFDVQLYAQPPKREECPICMLTLPYSDDESAYMECCGKTLCKGCAYCLMRECCPFCNRADPTSPEETMKWLSERIEKSDPMAMVILAIYHRNGLCGLPVDQSKAFELLQRACELGSAAGHFNLGISYYNGVGVEQDKKKAVHHMQIAAMMGHMDARHNIGISELNNGNYQHAMKHFMIASKCGYQKSLDHVKQGYKRGLVTKEELERSLRGYQEACDETRSEQRDQAALIRARERE